MYVSLDTGEYPCFEKLPEVTCHVVTRICIEFGRPFGRPCTTNKQALSSIGRRRVESKYLGTDIAVDKDLCARAGVTTTPILVNTRGHYQFTSRSRGRYLRLAPSAIGREGGGAMEIGSKS